MILVTGATGFVGRSIVRRLADHHEEIVPYTGRINNPIALREQMKGIETIIHLATGESRGRARRVRTVDVDGTDALLKAAEIMNVQRIIFLSHLGAEPNSSHVMLAAKGQAERMIRRSALRHTIIRSATLFGHEDHFTSNMVAFARRTWPFVWLPAGGKTPLQPLWVEDIANIIFDTVRRYDLDGETLRVAGEERFHYVDVARLVLEAAHLRRIPLKVPLIFFHTAATFNQLRRRPIINRFAVNRASLPEALPLDTVQRQFGFRPERLIGHLAYLRPGRRMRLRGA